MVCNVHWMSDTEAGMSVGAAAFARLQNNALFQATMSVARSELAAGDLSVPDTGSCEEEAKVLAMSD
jgi:acid phosphatase (class A)